MALWNLTRLAETLLPLLDAEEEKAIAEAEAALGAFGPAFERAYEEGLRRKLGLSTEREDDRALADALLGAMAENEVDFTLLFRGLADAQSPGEAETAVRALFRNPAAWDAWAAQWRARLALEPRDEAVRREAMRAVNPAFIPRNHKVEAMIRAAVDDGDYAPFHEMVELLSRPFDDQPGFEAYAAPPAEDERVLATFCGT
jgi:uncharacterized protein YdiU (UPF0061 family)